jgi:Divergent InlB B-repeat domain
MRNWWIGGLLCWLCMSCSGGRDEDVSGECVSQLDCPSGTVCRDGICSSENSSQASVSASGRAEGADAAIEWLADAGVICVQSEATRCTVPPGTRVTLRAPDLEGYRFAGWRGGMGCLSSSPVLELTVRANVDCVASYVQRVVVRGDTDSGSIQVRSDGAFARCADGACEVDVGDLVTLEAPLRDGAKLSGWEGQGCDRGQRSGQALSIEARVDTRCTALFTPSLTVRGTVQGAEAAVRASSDSPQSECSAQTCAVEPGATVQLAAPELPGFRFVGWSGGCLGSELVSTVSDVRESISCIATYVARRSARAESTGADPAPSLSAISADAFARCEGAGCEVDEGGSVTLLADTVSGFRLSEWSGDGCQAGASGSSTKLVDLRANVTCTARYVRGVSVTGTVLGLSGEVSATSQSPGAMCSSGSCAIDAGGTVTLEAPAVQGRTFLGWSGDPGCSGSGTTLVLADVDSSISCTARYAARFTVAGTPVPSELGTVTATSQTPNSVCGASSCEVDESADVTLQASPAANARFTGWSGGGPCSGAGPRLVLTNAQANLTCRATFAARVTLASGATPDGSGETTASSTSAQAQCSAGACTVDAGANVSVTATPAAGYRFLGWSGCSTSTANPLTVAVDAPTVCTARMERISFMVIASAGLGGAVSASSGGQDCPDASCLVPYGGSAELRAAAAPGYSFSGWSGCSTSTESTLTLLDVTAAASCTASFTLMRFIVSATAGPGGSVSASRGNQPCLNASCGVDFGGTVTLRAEPDASHTFGGWSCGSVEPVLTITNVMADQSCAARFELRRYDLNASAGAGGSLRTAAGLDATCTGSSCSVGNGGSVSFTAIPDADFAFASWTCSVGSPGSSQLATLGFTAVSEAHTCLANFRRVRFRVTVEGASGLSVEARTGGALCPNNVCTVTEGGSVDLLAFTPGNEARIFTSWAGCAAATPQLVPGRTDLAFTSSLSGINSDQTCSARAEAMAVVRAYQYTGRPSVTVDKLAYCVEGALGPRESSNNTVCKVPTSALVTLTAAAPAGEVFDQWECWNETSTGEQAQVFVDTPSVRIFGLAANQERACHAYYRRP